ncbi:uncharacterized protein LOC657683 [Tribolium castaneum]|uniref:Uncharacterized protein n=1 Tax=Tribolium castaneum TaxID=7070 RepID=D7EI03_TRICA|nr:PREDICTED: uncharacterized protein LOC657683 [Tribolium castaneum]EFA12937.2 hypothetical protein TcasGA2_TC010484 [Tribolium castaneum]|eukprot:XP_969223.1 PREDICTED: uncharacterized protein LOC657683 [Tribolium castaneum]
MSNRPILSRPRTRIYDANYNIGQNYYRSALDSIDRKYSPRAPSPLRPSIARDILDRHDEAFADEDLATSRLRAEKTIRQNHLFDSRGGRIAQRALDLVENDIDEETASTLKRIRANKKVHMLDDSDFDSTVDNINSHRLLERSEKALRSVGLNENSRRALDEDVSIKRRSLKVSFENETQNGDMVKWSPLQQRSDERESAAAIRARKSRDRILDLEDEMAAMTEKQAARERRAARFKALVAESTEQTEAAQSALQAISFKSRREQRTLEE